MGVFQFTTPDGKKFKVTAPDAQTAIESFNAAMEGQQKPADPRGAMSIDNAARAVARGTPVGSFLDELNAATNATLAPAVEWMLPRSENDIAQNGETWQQRYDKSLAMQRGKDQAFDEQNPVASTALQVTGGLASIGGLAKGGLTLAGQASNAGLLGRMGLGAAEGAAYGGVYGFGAGEGGIENRVASGAGGAAAGGILGGALPAVTAGVRKVATPVVNAISARVDPGGYAARKVVERLGKDNLTPGQVANKIDRAAANGDNLSVADVGGENAKGLLRTASNVPGAGRQRIQTNARLQAMQQGDRIGTKLGEALDAPEGSYQSVKEGIIRARATAADPYYKVAYKQPVPYTRSLEETLKTPAGKAALATAKRNSLNRREPWAQWFASIDDEGNIIDKRRVPDTRALDETQRVLRQMVEDAKAKPDGSPFAKARNTPQSIAIDSVLKDLLKEIDGANPAFAKARSIALDNIQADEALEFGRNALTTDARVVAKQFADLNDGQKQLARIGVADAVREKINSAGYTHNALLRFFSTRGQLDRLRPFFETDADWSKFRRSMFNEARMRSTYNAVTGNSTTARQLADMNEAGGLENMAQTGIDAVTRGPVTAAIGGTARWITGAAQRLGGLTPETANEMSKILLTRDPKTVNNLMLRLKSIEASQAAGAVKAAQVRQLLADFGALEISRELSAQPTPRLAPPQTSISAP